MSLLGWLLGESPRPEERPLLSPDRRAEASKKLHKLNEQIMDKYDVYMDDCGKFQGRNAHQITGNDPLVKERNQQFLYALGSDMTVDEAVDLQRRCEEKDMRRYGI